MPTTLTAGNSIGRGSRSHHRAIRCATCWEPRSRPADRLSTAEPRGPTTRAGTPTTGEISVATASVDTGIGERSKHAREGYLLAGPHPRLTFTLGELIAARQDTPNVVAFRARGTITLIGKTQQKFTRADFNVGTEPGPEESVAKDLEIQLQLTLKKT